MFGFSILTLQRRWIIAHKSLIDCYGAPMREAWDSALPAASDLRKKERECRIGENDTFSKLSIFRQERQISMTKVSNESSEHFNSSRYQFIVAKFSLHTEKCGFLKVKIFLSTDLLTSSDHSEKWTIAYLNPWIVRSTTEPAVDGD